MMGCDGDDIVGQRRWRRGHCGLLALLAGVALACGCGGEPRDRVAVSGTVRLDGQPLDGAAIMFIPAAGTIGPKAAAAIHAGQYVLKQDEGPAAGKLQVEIWETEPSIAPGEKPPTKHPVERIPATYNRESTLLVETVQGGPNEFHFELKSDQPNSRR